MFFIVCFPCNAPLCHSNTNKQKNTSRRTGKNLPRGFSRRWLFLPLQRCLSGASQLTLLAAQLTCPCVPSARCAHYQGRGLHRVLGHRHCPLARRIPVRRVLSPGVLPAALAGRRRSQVSAHESPWVTSGTAGDRPADRGSLRKGLFRPQPRKEQICFCALRNLRGRH